MSLEIHASLGKILFQSRDGDFAVGELFDTRSSKFFKASGALPRDAAHKGKQIYRVFGEWVDHSKYGRTFSVIYCEPLRPQDLSGMIPFLADNVDGVGEVTAKKFLLAMETKTLQDLLDIATNSPQKIRDHFKSKPQVAERILHLLTNDDLYRSIMLFLHEHQLPPNFVRKIHDRYGAHSMAILKENPYRLITDFRNVGFVKADKIAEKLGVNADSPFRVEAAAAHCLESALHDGHCCLPRDALIQRMTDLLRSRSPELFTPESVLERLRDIFRKNRDAGTHTFSIRTMALHERQEALFYIPDVLRTEDDVAQRIHQLMSSSGIGTERHEGRLSDLKGLERQIPDYNWSGLSEEQLAAVLHSVSSRLMVLTGGPGCGKTHVLKGIHAVQKELKRSIALCAPTGLAAKRMSASIGMTASTLHKLLRIGEDGSTPPPAPSTEAESLATEVEDESSAPLDGVDVVICDEASMLSLELLHTLLRHLGPNRRLILVGDVDQLPSVGAGNCLRDIISSGLVPVVRLTKIFRQAGDSPIPEAARSIITGHMPRFSWEGLSPTMNRPESMAFVRCKKEDFLNNLLHFLRHTVPEVYGLDPLKQCQILVPMRKSEVGQEKINLTLQDVFNPERPGSTSAPTLGDMKVRTGDKIIQTRNNYAKDVFNGDLGFCDNVLKDEDGDWNIDLKLDEKTVTLKGDELRDIQLCYAMTIHKSQGSEFPLCVVPMFSSYWTMLDRNLLYTAITRASRHVVLFGEEWAVHKAVQSTQAQKRWTALEGLLRNPG